MSHLNELIRQLATKDEALAKDIEREVAALTDRRAFGLNFERHQPEAVELPGRKVRRGDKVRILPPRGEMPKKANDRLWRVVDFTTHAGTRVASLVPLDETDETAEVAVDDLVVVAEFRDPIYPGLVSTGKVECGGDKPYHSVINAENYHALQALLFTHRGKVDCIYIDPPYNTGAKDWKYNNDYVEGDDLYRHSKWLAFMERRLLLAKELLNPDDSVLIVTIDEKEYLRLGMLLEQVFPEATIQMVSAVIAPQGSQRPGQFSRVEEYIFYVLVGSAVIDHGDDQMLDTSTSVQKSKDGPSFDSLIRRGTGALRSDRPGMFYPVYLREGAFDSVGEAIPLNTHRDSTTPPDGVTPVWPVRTDGSEGRWQVGPERLRELFEKGYARVGATRAGRMPAITYLKGGEIAKLEGDASEDSGRISARSVWNRPAHNAGSYGSSLLRSMIPGRKFPFPKALYAVEDSLRFAVRAKLDAIVVDFFSGSGTTAHATMRLNKQDGGHRRSISITNNEVSADEQSTLRVGGSRPGDDTWEQRGICDYITKPRIAAAITGTTPEGVAIVGDYRFTDEFPMADGFEENVEFFTLTYESPLRVEANREFARIAPLLWLRAGSKGRRIDALPDGWDVAETYGVISDLDRSQEFARAITAAPDASVAFIITEEDRLFESLVRELPDQVEPVRLYEAYLRTFEIEARRAAER